MSNLRVSSYVVPWLFNICSTNRRFVLIALMPRLEPDTLTSTATLLLLSACELVDSSASSSWNPPRRRRRTVKHSAAALANFGWRGGAPQFFRRHEYVSGWRGGGIRRLTGLIELLEKV
jgi:hypothetical protein